jgi:thiamine-monophosphate kinase
VSTDTSAEGVHFPVASCPAAVAYRAVAAAVSDLAAMGAGPLAMTLAISLPEARAAWLDALRAGLREAVHAFSLPLVGGDTTRGPLALTVTVLGCVPAGTALRRDAARPGDRLCVSGTLGDSAAGLASLRGELEESAALAALRERFWRPQPRLDLGRDLRGVAGAAIDVSDGLLADAAHLAAASGVRLEVRADALPLSPALRSAVSHAQAREWALSGGEDYELCFTLPPGAPLPAGCSVIGSVEAGSGVGCDLPPGGAGGYRHF